VLAREAVGRAREVEVLVGDSTGVVRRQRKRHAAVADQNVRVMLHRLRVCGNRLHERHRLDEVLEAVGPLDLLAGLGPFGQFLEPSRDLRIAEFGERHRR